MTISFWPAFFGVLAALTLWRAAPYLARFAIFSGVAAYLYRAKLMKIGNALFWFLIALGIIGKMAQ